MAKIIREKSILHVLEALKPREREIPSSQLWECFFHRILINYFPERGEDSSPIHPTACMLGVPLFPSKLCKRFVLKNGPLILGGHLKKILHALKEACHAKACEKN